MESVRKARARAQRYPQFLVECAPSAAAYAKCVLTHSNISYGDCEEHYRIFERCMRDAAKRNNSRL